MSYKLQTFLALLGSLAVGWNGYWIGKHKADVWWQAHGVTLSPPPGFATTTNVIHFTPPPSSGTAYASTTFSTNRTAIPMSNGIICDDGHGMWAESGKLCHLNPTERIKPQ